MRITKIVIFWVLSGIYMSSCIERYHLDSEIDFEPRLVVDATITDDGEEQEIIISRSADPQFPVFQPESGCVVRVEDKQGNHFYFDESATKGHYRGMIENHFMTSEAAFRLFIETAEKEQYLSRFERLVQCPEVDSVYYQLESRSTSDPDVVEEGVQFFIDLKADDNDGRFFRWKLEESWEYHSKWPITRYLDSDGWHNNGEDYSLYTCYQTEDIRKVFTLSTMGLNDNSYEMFPLHFVNDHTQRLKHQYSLLVEQYSLTEGAWNYWENLRKNNQEADDMFGKLPASLRGNIFNVNDSLKSALGYFSVSSVSSKRIQIRGIDNLRYNNLPICVVTLEKDVDELPEDPLPLFFTQVPDENLKLEWGYANAGCFICTMKGGTTEKPDYWIDE
ncbi:DUF4249 domain-containing protein [Sunxiuqinia sp. sy24]|uniref:DUF4249 domain-containing protein n=1 Tax=Sunxiuqinia sp. sy24 TaxID=3461495 RepID=UPI0040457539